MTKYFVHSSNSLSEGWNGEYDTVHDAGVAVKAIKMANGCLEDCRKFHGWVTCWNGYSLDDGSKVTVSAEPVVGLDF